MNRTDPIVDWSVIVEHSSYAKPTLSSKFKMVRKTVNKLAKYRPTQDVPGINWNQKGNKSKKMRMSMDPKPIKSFQALSKVVLTNAETYYAKKIFNLKT